MLKEMLKERNLPEFLEREKMVDILLEEEYGKIPEIDYEMSVSEPVTVEGRYCAGKVVHSKVDMTIKTKYGSHTFKVDRLIRKDGEKHPFFVYVSIFSETPNRYFPIEEMAESGLSVLSVGFKDITKDDGNFNDGLAKVLLGTDKREGNTAGKIRIWAFALSRILDYAETIPELDMENAAVVGHSRLGKTALVAGMTDERFKFVISNDSGCSGAAISKGGMGHLGKVGPYQAGESIKIITGTFPYWFCENYQKYREQNYPDDFDQHFLLASIAPRFLYISSASMDDWADQDSEFLGGVKASEVYEKLGYKGLIHKDKLPEIDEKFQEGRIGYHKRFGLHFLSRHDWKNYVEFIKLHKDEK